MPRTAGNKLPKGLGAPKKDTVPLRMSVSRSLHNYLGFLSRNTTLGGSENDVALYLLTERLQGMIEGRYHEKHKPPTD